ncbi:MULTISPECIES: hypothetical protein [unclassified Pseudomonas]|uniref:hypothetical protein n=1 Tax=unclassified Pseudomonas TaxID=196821 RepID=UPI0011AC9D8A|nr:MULTISPECIES: hypothetical protein [unclassified Pseudomonas]TWC21106.1 hypothetical protein FBY00_103118 [Pseudomonas sp. SJZ075]TWC36586.1 hypothetical protein FBY02_103118 [Pseudomonas sp. SJZ078]TWC57345.1 hypothetical protein FBY11_103118 [Pseudomonas sp. SJZ124]TWC92358.1 hypothetical protein FBY09_103166 [Pseudomonas sp. SJZ101]
MLVIATEHPVPLMPVVGHPGTGHIQPDPAEPVDVPEHSYYLRRIASGELKRVVESATPSAKSGAKTSTKGRK